MITPNRVMRLIKAMGSRNALAARMEVTENTVRRWEQKAPDSISVANKRELERLLEQYEIN